MAIKIGSNGAIYKNNEELQSSNPTIHEDGTIEIDNLSLPQQPSFASLSASRAVPTSPLDGQNARNRDAMSNNTVRTNEPANHVRGDAATLRRIATIEADIQMAENTMKLHDPTKYWKIAGICFAASLFIGLTIFIAIPAAIMALKHRSVFRLAEQEK